MQKLFLITILLLSQLGFSQQKNKQKVIEKQANNFVYEGNTLVNEDFVAAEMAYRKALSKQEGNIAGAYNLGNSYYKEGNYQEALYRHQQTAKLATSKAEKHKAYHNMGNVFMQTKKCKEAVEAYKNALRNNPTDDETRYNLGLAKDCAKQQEQENKDNKDDKEDKDNSEDKKDENKENKDENKKDDKKEGEGDDEDKKDENSEKEDEKDKDEKPEDDEKKADKGKGDEDEKEQQPQPREGRLSPQQVKNLLEAMNNQEQKVQDKINAEQQKGVKIKTEKDW